MLISVTLISVIIGVVEGLPLFKNKMWKEFGALIILLLIAVILVLAKKFFLRTPLDILSELLFPIGKKAFRS